MSIFSLNIIVIFKTHEMKQFAYVGKTYRFEDFHKVDRNTLNLNLLKLFFKNFFRKK